MKYPLPEGENWKDWANLLVEVLEQEDGKLNYLRREKIPSSTPVSYKFKDKATINGYLRWDSKSNEPCVSYNGHFYKLVKSKQIKP